MYKRERDVREGDLKTQKRNPVVVEEAEIAVKPTRAEEKTERRT